jgi:large subunit ribosomal protein L21
LTLVAPKWYKAVLPSLLPAARGFPARSRIGSKDVAQSLVETGVPVYAIVNINGIQTRVAPDEVLEVARLAGEPGKQLSFGEILMVSDGDKVTVGQPYVKGASLTAEVVEHLRGPKLRIFKFKRRNDYRKRRGHRDELTRIRVTGIET